MPDDFHEITFAIEAFARDQLPPDQRGLTGDALLQAIRQYLEDSLGTSVGRTEILVTPQIVRLRWHSSRNPPSVVDRAMDLLRSGNFERAIPLLHLALSIDAENPAALYNLGMALSDQGRVEDAIEHLSRLVELEPSHSNGWVALGVAFGRNNQVGEAEAALRSALELQPHNPHALKNLGVILCQEPTSQTEAKALLSKASELAPNDPHVWVNLGRLNEETGDFGAADQAYRQVLRIDPDSQLGDQAKQGKSRIAQRNFHAQTEGLRPDALLFCSGAIECFQGRPLSEVQSVTFEIAMLGMNGLDVNDPAPKYTLRSLEGKFSGLQLICIEYAGFQILDPSVDIGFDLSKEYAAAKSMGGTG